MGIAFVVGWNSVLEQLAKVGQIKTWLKTSFTDKTSDFTEADIPVIFPKRSCIFFHSRLLGRKFASVCNSLHNNSGLLFGTYDCL